MAFYNKRPSKRALFLWGLVVVLLIYLFRPINTDATLLKPDEKLLAGKRDYLANTKPSPTDERPNIILLFADDLGKFDISLYGGKEVPTPNIDALAASGATLTDGYVTAPICSPSRAGLLTGRYQQRFGHELQPGDRYPGTTLEYLIAKHFILNDGDWKLNDLKHPFPSPESQATQGLPQSEITFADLGKSQGYATGIVGKWHLGHTSGFTPLERGFDYHYGFYQAFSLFSPVDAPGIVIQRHTDATDKFIWELGRVGTGQIRRDNTVLDEKEYLTEKFAEEAEGFIEKNKEKPFLLYVPFNAPHTPFQVPQSYYERFPDVKDNNKRVYYAMISALDDAVGRIVQKVRAAGLEEKTLFIFTSDNGGAAYTHATNNAPLKGGKLSHFEGGINVPFVVSWKGKIAPNTQYHHPVNTLDIFSTIAANIHAPLPADRTYDGVDLVEKIGSNTPAHEALFWRSGTSKAVRRGDWKLVISGQSDKRWLYDLANDKAESKDLAGANPEKVKELEAALAEWEKGLVAPLWRTPVRNEQYFGGELYVFDI